VVEVYVTTQWQKNFLGETVKGVL